MSKSLAVINCSQIITLAGPARPRVGSELLELALSSAVHSFVRGSRIEKVGAQKEIDGLWLMLIARWLTPAVASFLPGFIDAHAHTGFCWNSCDEFEERAAGATYQEIAARGGGYQIDSSRHSRGRCR
jgi:imidazolonepropionase